MNWIKLIEENLDLEAQANDMVSKVLLSIKEASSLFGIGQHRLREIVSEDYEIYHRLKNP